MREANSTNNDKYSRGVNNIYLFTSSSCSKLARVLHHSITLIIIVRRTDDRSSYIHQYFFFLTCTVLVN